MKYRTGDVVEVTDGMSKDYAIIRKLDIGFIGGSSREGYRLICDRFTYSFLDNAAILRKVSSSEMKGCSKDFRKLAERLELSEEVLDTVRRQRAR